jgi:hypothetical protein
MYRTEIVTIDISLLSPADGSNGRPTSNGRDSRSGTSQYSDAAEDYGDVGITDQDIPF